MAGDSLKCVHLVRGGEDVFRTCRKGLASTLCMGGGGEPFSSIPHLRQRRLSYSVTSS